MTYAKWEKYIDPLGKTHENIHFCSECKKYALFKNMGIECLSNYCPYCGASMLDNENGGENVK